MRDAAKPLTVGIDARLRHGQTGGIESVLIGLAASLSTLDGEERYLFFTIEGEDDWITKHLSGPASPVRTKDRRGRFIAQIRPHLERVIPSARSVGKRVVRSKGPRPSDGAPERAGVDVLHFPHQWGFLTDIPSIYQPHDLQHRHLPELFGKDEVAIRDLWYQALCAQAELVAVASTWTRSDLIDQFGLAPGKVQVVPWAPPLDAGLEGADRNDTDARLGDLPERFVLYPAQTWPHKNHVSLVRAIAMLSAEGLRVPLVFTGKRTPTAVVIDQTIQELDMVGQVTWMGFVEPQTLRAVYGRATAVVIPSRFEAASAPLWEAFSAGVPAACSRVTSLPRQAGDAALLFEPDRVDQIAAAIRQLWTDVSLRRQLIEKGRQQVAPFTWDRTARLFRAHYRQVAGRPLSPEDKAMIEAPPII